MLAPDGAGRWVTSERGIVTEADEHDLTVQFAPERSVTLTGQQIDNDHLDHAYAVTVHHTQGATVDTAHVLADGGGRELAYVAMGRASHTTHVHAVADDLDQAREDLTLGWTTERRDRWIHDIDTPAKEGDRLRPTLAREPGSQARDFQTRPERDALTETIDRATDHQQKIDAATRRLDAIQNRPRPPDQGLGLG